MEEHGLGTDTLAVAAACVALWALTARRLARWNISSAMAMVVLGLVPRWLVIFGAAAGLVLLLSAGYVPWLELIFPLWVFCLLYTSPSPRDS